MVPCPSRPALHCSSLSMPCSLRPAAGGQQPMWAGGQGDRGGRGGRRAGSTFSQLVDSREQLAGKGRAGPSAMDRQGRQQACPRLRKSRDGAPSAPRVLSSPASYQSWSGSGSGISGLIRSASSAPLLPLRRSWRAPAPSPASALPFCSRSSRLPSRPRGNQLRVCVQ